MSFLGKRRPKLLAPPGTRRRDRSESVDRRDRRDRRSGHALILAAMLGVLAMTMWLVAYRATEDALAFAQGEEQRRLRTEILPEAIARGARLLETGVPPTSGFRCVSRHRNAAGDWVAITLRYERLGAANRWAIRATPSTPQEKRALEPLPTWFRGPLPDVVPAGGPESSPRLPVAPLPPERDNAPSRGRNRGRDDASGRGRAGRGAVTPSRRSRG